MSEKAPSINPDAEQAVTFADHEYRSKKTGDVVAHHVKAIDEHGNETHVSIDDMLLARGYETRQPGKPAKKTVETPDPLDPATPDDINPYEIWAQGVQTARDKVSRKRMVHAHMAADDYAEGHDRIDNPHIDHLSPEEKKAFALAQADKQAHADRIAGDGAYDEEFDRIRDDVQGKVDKEIKDRLESDNSTWEYWEGDNPDDGEGGDDDDKEEEPKPPTIYEIMDEIIAKDELYKERAAELVAARDEYAKLTAKRRKISTLGIKGRGTSKEELAAAKKKYEEARTEAGKHVAGRLVQIGASPDQIEIFSVLGAGQEAWDLEYKIVEKRLEEADGKRFKYFYDKWASWGGGAKFFSEERIKGNIKKALALGIPLGALSLVASPFIGAGIATVSMFGIARGLARGHVDKSAGAEDLANAQGQAHYEQTLREIGEAHAAGKTDFQAEDITEQVEGHTKKEVFRNRKRLGKAALIGALAPLAADKVADFVGGLDINWPWNNPAGKVMGDMTPKPPRVPDNPFEGMSINELEDFRWMTSHPEQFGNLQARASELQAMHPGWSPMQIRAHLKEALRSGGNINRS